MKRINMKNVINREGVAIDYEAAVMLMDDELREQLANSGDYETEQAFFSAYETAHEKKFGQPWELSKANPVW